MTKATNKYSPEVRERAVRMVLEGAGQHESRWAAIVSISSKIGCAPQTLNEWVKKVEVDTGQRGGITTEHAEVIHRRGPWRSFDAVEYATLEWVDWFNNRRLLEPIGNIPPAEAEANFYAALERSDMAA